MSGTGRSSGRTGSEPEAELQRLRTAAHALRAELRTMPALPPGTVVDGPAATLDAAAMVRQLDDHVLPRLDHLDAPALVVVGGSTGSGKSLLVNSIIGADVTRPGVLRPTTMAPVLVHDPASAEWFSATHVLPGLARVHSGEAHGHQELRVIASDAIPDGLALLDSPDFDSVSDENRALAAELLAAADLWVFVTTAARYADAVPWSFLDRAREQGTPMIVVMNRVPAGQEATLREHLAQMLTERGLGAVEVLTVVEQPLQANRLPAESVVELRTWLARLGSDPHARAAAVRRSLAGSIADLARRTEKVAAAVAANVATVEMLRTLVHHAYGEASAQVRTDIGQGTLLKGEVLSRWEELLGTGELLRQLRTGVARLRDRVTGAVTGRPKTDVELHGAVENVVEALIRTRGDEAASRAARAWRSHPVGVQLLADESNALLDRSSPELAASAAATVRDWQGFLLELVRGVGGNRRTKARVASFGVNGVALVVMVLVFAHTGGVTGAEGAVAVGASAIGHTLLEAVLGDQTVRRLALDARSDLETRVDSLYASEVSRFDAALGVLGSDPDAPTRLRALASQLGSGSDRMLP